MLRVGRCARLDLSSVLVEPRRVNKVRYEYNDNSVLRSELFRYFSRFFKKGIYCSVFRVVGEWAEFQSGNKVVASRKSQVASNEGFWKVCRMWKVCGCLSKWVLYGAWCMSYYSSPYDTCRKVRPYRSTATCTAVPGFLDDSSNKMHTSVDVWHIYV